jgi:hypothetical protein
MARLERLLQKPASDVGPKLQLRPRSRCRARAAAQRAKIDVLESATTKERQIATKITKAPVDVVRCPVGVFVS